MSEVAVFSNSAELVAAARAMFVDIVATAQRERGTASVVLTGGSNGVALLRMLREDSDGLDWSNLDIFWGDERFVTSEDPERNAGQAAEALLHHVPVDPARVFPIAASDGEFGDDIEAAASSYAQTIVGRGGGKIPDFDLHLVGMGGEGHINSLFPHTSAVAERSRVVVAVEDSPKPPPRRVTLTLPAVNRSKQVWFLVAGSEKAEAVKAGVTGADPSDWPCAGAHGTEATVWFLDQSAARLL